VKQIILITDGCSNVGMSPVVAAAHAQAEGIVVNVVGVVDQGEIGEFGAAEIDEIAKAGGGLSRMVNTRQLSQTVQMMTRKTVVQTIQQAVNKELRHIFGTSAIEELPPEKRAQVVQVIDDLGETSSLQVALLIDASASMKPKLVAVEEAIRDLTLSLQARSGTSEIAVFHFPGPHNIELVMDTGWTSNMAGVKQLFSKINMKGTTPTGPALLKVLHYFRYGNIEGSGMEDADRRNTYERNGTDDKGGMLGDYVV